MNQVPGAVNGLAINLRERADDFLEGLGSLMALFGRAGAELMRTRPRVQGILSQMEILGLKSLPIALLVAVFSGMVLVLQTGVQLSRFGAESYAAGIAAIALSREIVPVLCSLVLAGRISSGIAAEIGTMQVTEQVDALRAMGTDPIIYLVLPRAIAAAFMLPLMTTLGIATGIFGGLLVGTSKLGLTGQQYINSTLNWLTQSDFTTGIGKTFVFGVIIAVVGCHEGFRTTGGASGVGRATTQAVVVSSVLILIVNYFLTDWFVRIFG